MTFREISLLYFVNFKSHKGIGDNTNESLVASVV
jgi:hypothetical protein